MNNSRVPVAEAHDQVTEWLLEGASYREMSKLTGLSIGSLHKVASSRKTMVYEGTKRKIAEAFSERLKG